MLLRVARPPPGDDRERERDPGLEAPRQRRHDHVGPVGVQRVHRRVERPDASLELRDQVLLVTALAGLLHDLDARERGVIGDVKKVADVVEQDVLALLDRQIFLQRDDPVGPRAGGGLVVEINHRFADGRDVLEAALPDDAVLDTRRPRARLQRPVGAAHQRRVQRGRRGLPPLHHCLRGVVPEDEAHAGVGPAVKGPREGKVGVAPQEDIGEPGPTAQRDRLVEIRQHALVRGPVAAAVLEEERLPGVGERDDEWVVTPEAGVGNVHPLFAGARRRDQRPVAIDPRRLLGQPRTALPDRESRLVEGVH